MQTFDQVSFETRLFSTVETCVPPAAIAYPLATYKQYIHMSIRERGSVLYLGMATELLNLP